MASFTFWTPEELDQLSALLMLAPGKKKFLSQKELEARLLKEAQLVALVSPLPSVDEKDVDGAYRLFGAPSSSSQTAIKKVYKKMAADRHPDRLAGGNFPAHFCQLAHDNFAKIQTAYRTIKESKKGKRTKEES